MSLIDNNIPLDNMQFNKDNIKPNADFKLMQNEILPLNQSGSSYVIISKLPNELIEYGNNSFEELFALHPQEKNNIIMKGTNENTKKFRYSNSYFKTPKYDKNDSYFENNNYMYGGINDNVNDDLPELFMPFYLFAKQIDENYNQVLINWYEKEDYIQYHKDCQRQLNKNIPVMIFNINDSTINQNDEKNIRKLDISSYNRKNDPNGLVHSIYLRNGTVVKLCGEIHNEFKHGVKINENAGRRISISFRAIIDDNENNNNNFATI